VLILTQFILRLSFGLAAAMSLTPFRRVTSGYYRNNLYVLLGLNVLVALVSWSAPPEMGLALWPPVVAAVLSYLAAASWLYERAGPGLVLLVAIAGVCLAGAMLDAPAVETACPAHRVLAWLDPVGGGWLLGTTMAAMLLGHWYLNAPGMQLAPLRRLVVLMAIAVGFRAVLSGCGLALMIAQQGAPGLRLTTLLALRWLSGLVGTGLVTWMTWQTLKIPNTQSATGILYVGVIAAFLGELTAQLLSRDALFPL
jgi:hypothetical protein